MGKKFLWSGVAFSVVLGSVFLMSSGGSKEVAEENESDIMVAEKSRLISSIQGRGEVRVAGPCYEGSRGNDVFPPDGEPASDCYNLMSEGSDYLDARGSGDDIYVRVSNGSDSVYLGSGDDVIDMRGSFDMVIDAGAGFNILNFPGLDVPDIELRVEGEDIILEGKRGSIRMRRQYPREGSPAPIQLMVFESAALNASEIYLRAIDGQSSDGDDILTGTPGDDVIYPGLGNDMISGLEGDDSIFYEGGNDIVMGSYEGVGFDTVSFPYSFSQVYLEAESNRDLLIITPSGTLTLQFQVFFPPKDPRSNIESFIFKDGIYSAEDLKAALAEGSKKRPNPELR